MSATVPARASCCQHNADHTCIDMQATLRFAQTYAALTIAMDAACMCATHLLTFFATPRLHDGVCLPCCAVLCAVVLQV
jgi:hypothetical protein